MKASIFLISLLIFSVSNLQCGEENIDHCIECGSDSEINSCKTCEEKYFPFLDNVLCLPCDDELYGHKECGGKCNNIIHYDLEKSEFYCLNDCKEGYFYLDNSCFPCSYKTIYCGKCIYDAPPGEFNLSHFECTACESNQYNLKSYRNTKICVYCYMTRCEQCHFEEGISICDKCFPGYYLKNNSCQNCYWTVESEGKIYEICSDDSNDYNSSDFYCTTHYTKGDSNQCIKCPDNCYSCGYDSLNKNLNCFSCDEGYTLNSKGICVSCGDNCDYCYLDKNENPICLFCKNGYPPNEDKNCLSCGDNCKSCIKGKDNNIECTKCRESYALNKNKECEKCPSNCKNCFWNEDKGNLSCSECLSNYYNTYVLGKDDTCVTCQSIGEIGGEGCSDCYYDNSSSDNKYKCTICSNNYFASTKYVYLENEYKCISEGFFNICPTTCSNFMTVCRVTLFDSSIARIFFSSSATELESFA